MQVEGEVLETLPDSLQEFFAQNPLVSNETQNDLMFFCVNKYTV